jgi:hypothetical protein
MRLYPLKGKVLLADGKPLASGSVQFIGTKSQVTSAAPIESDGGFSFKDPNGLPEGEYRVVIEFKTPAAPGRNVLTERANLPFASKYADDDGSDLKAVVTRDESTNNFEFRLEAKNDVSSSPSPRAGR